MAVRASNNGVALYSLLNMKTWASYLKASNATLGLPIS